ncbi:MAG: 2'-5' RNA ligase family protein [Halobacteriota archaeon]|uniref:2'-5' RNA ligase family protein n=1 Tax=Natronomonas sp. TaxID=2184060 RepID=UPI003975167F
MPVPTEISRLARGLASDCFDATTRDRHTLVLKRLGDGAPARLARRIRRELAGVGPFEARPDGVGTFRTPPVGRGPVAYIRIESPTLVELHRRLCTAFEPIDGIEGDDYVPHVTIARGGDADRLLGRDFDNLTWEVESLSVWSAEYGEEVERISLPIR